MPLAPVAPSAALAFAFTLGRSGLRGLLWTALGRLRRLWRGTRRSLLGAAFAAWTLLAALTLRITRLPDRAWLVPLAVMLPPGFALIASLVALAMLGPALAPVAVAMRLSPRLACIRAGCHRRRRGNRGSFAAPEPSQDAR